MDQFHCGSRMWINSRINSVLENYMRSSDDDPNYCLRQYSWNPEFFDQIVEDFNNQSQNLNIFYHCGYKCHCGYNLRSNGERAAGLTLVRMNSYNVEHEDAMQHFITATESGQLNGRQTYRHNHTILKLYRSGKLDARRSGST